MKGISTTLAPKLRRPADKLFAWWRARPIRIRVPARGRTSLGVGMKGGLRSPSLRLLRHSESRSIDFFEYRIAAANLNCQCSLTGCRSHYIDGNHLPDELRLA